MFQLFGLIFTPIASNMAKGKSWISLLPSSVFDKIGGTLYLQELTRGLFKGLSMNYTSNKIDGGESSKDCWYDVETEHLEMLQLLPVVDSDYCVHVPLLQSLLFYIYNLKMKQLTSTLTSSFLDKILVFLFVGLNSILSSAGSGRLVSTVASTGIKVPWWLTSLSSSSL